MCYIQISTGWHKTEPIFFILVYSSINKLFLKWKGPKHIQCTEAEAYIVQKESTLYEYVKVPQEIKNHTTISLDSGLRNI